MKKLFLDDERNLKDAVLHLKLEPRIYLSKGWEIVRSYKEFVAWIKKNGVPDEVSFDHDLGAGKSGYDCAVYLKDYCDKVGKQPDAIYVHSMNPVGRQNIIRIFK